MDCSEKMACIKCEGDENLLVCTEDGCPLAVHRECMDCPAQLDDAGHFYCPYCCYKKAAEELRLATEYALSRKKAMLIFTDEGVTSGEKHLNESKIAENNVCNDVSNISAGTAMAPKCDDGTISQNVDDVIGQPIPCDDKIGGTGKEIISREDSEAFEVLNGQNPASEMHEEENITHTEEKKLTEEGFETYSAAEAHDLSLKVHSEKNIAHTEEMIQEKKHETDAASADRDSSVMVQEEDGLQEVHEKLYASAGEEPAQDVPARSKRGLRSGSVGKPSKTSKPKVKHSAVAPVRRSSRRISSSQ